MKKIFLIKNPEVFQGEKNLKRKKNYFEGWYFKNTNKNYGISFIPGININNNNKNDFIQIITTDSSYFIDYDINDFEFSYEPFYIKIGNNYFSKDGIIIDINDKKHSLIIKGNIKYSNNKNININLFNPNIMGPFSYIPFMECNHAILSMKSIANGFININNKEIIFNNDTSYIEKDWGISFPKSYIWCQGNDFKNKNISFMLSIADIPFKIFNFRGFICSLIINDKEYRFTTYNNAKIVKYDIYDDKLDIVIKKGKYYLSVKSNCGSGFKLISPVKGKMNKDIIESISSKLKITLKKDNKIIFSGISKNCGLEIV